MRIAEGRRRELSAGHVWHVKTGGVCHLVTLTFPHASDDRLVELLDRFDKARQRWANSRTYKRITAAAGYLGRVTSLEVTYGHHAGWHPHLHAVWYLRRELTPAETEQLRAEWIRCLLKDGLGSQAQLAEMLAHAFDVRGGRDAADYILKYGREEVWGISAELTRSHAKDARGEHFKPFGLLRAANEGESWAAERFREFAEAIKGKRLTTWSPGLRAALQLGQDLTDDVLADEPLPDEYTVATLSSEQWSVVLAHDARAELLEYVRIYCTEHDTGQDDVDEFIAWLRKRSPRRPRPWYCDSMRGGV
jgi:hypothetical protein